MLGSVALGQMYLGGYQGTYGPAEPVVTPPERTSFAPRRARHTMAPGKARATTSTRPGQTVAPRRNRGGA